jgi:Fe-S-cluster-containing hydrogenase component 2/CRP-like cAMP-binding protein
MAKQVNPPAVLDPRPDDVDVPPHLLGRLPPFSQLKAALSLDKFPGACKLRFLRAGDEVCVYREPGWSAFCFVPAPEIAALRDHAAEVQRVGPSNRENLVGAVARLEADLDGLRQELSQPDLADKDKKDLEKKLASTERDLEKREASLAVLDEELAKLPEVRRRFDAWLQQQNQEQATARERRQQAAARLPALIAKARGTKDASRLPVLDEVPGAPAARQRQLADLLEPTAPELAECLRDVAAADGVERVAVARLPRVRPHAPTPIRGWLERMRGWLRGERHRPATLPGDGPLDLDYYSRLSSLYDGELVGEISCLNRTPRSATITMVRDGFVVELMRNLLDQMGKDAAYKARLEAATRQRLLNSALREIPLFADLPEAELAHIGRSMEFLAYKPGSLICDEHEEADSLYVIGNGIVKVVTGVSWLLPASANVDAAALRQELAAPGGNYVEARASLAGMLAGAEGNAVPVLNRLLAQRGWRDAPALRAVMEGEQLVPQLWRMLASAEYSGTRGLVRCNRLLVQTLDPLPQVYPAFKPGPLDAETDDAFRLAEFAATDWKKFCNRLVADDKKPEDVARVMWDRLPAAVRERLRQGKTTELAPADKEAIVAGLNAVLRGDLLLQTTAGDMASLDDPKLVSKLSGQLRPILAQSQLWSDFDFQRWNRHLNRLALEALCPRVLGVLPRPSGLPTILAYRSSNEMLGEKALLQQQPRTATLVTYNHPNNDPDRDVGPVHLFRIGKAMFDEMVERSPILRNRLADLARTRDLAQEGRLPALAGRVNRELLHTPRGEELGLIEGQQLMLIDLDRCTRCDECVRACVDTHDDGRSRLFLVGERHARYLVPATCRSCLDPVCMIGCPVNSIQRGDNKEILIRNWCIGCELCAKQCPYGSIQMHDIGLVPEASRGWRFAAAPPDEAWTQPRFNDGAWLVGTAPFDDDVTFAQELGHLAGHAPRGPVAFRRRFSLAAAEYLQDASFQLELVAPDDKARVWLNGKELRTEEKIRQGKRKYHFGPAQQFFRQGDNVLAVLVPRPARATGQIFFSVRLDAERDADSPAVEIKLVTARAVVCDLCSGLSTGPACVNACPHDAAMRVNAVGVSGR